MHNTWFCEGRIRSYCMKKKEGKKKKIMRELRLKRRKKTFSCETFYLFDEASYSRYLHEPTIILFELLIFLSFNKNKKKSSDVDWCIWEKSILMTFLFAMCLAVAVDLWHECLFWYTDLVCDYLSKWKWMSQWG